MDMNVLQAIQDEIRSGRKVCQIVITKAEGSTPRSTGTMMVVRQDGSIEGTVGGGLVEFEAIKRAKELFCNGRCEMNEYVIKTDQELMAGKVTLFYKVFAPGEQLLIFGAGHVGYQLYTLARMLHFEVMMLDEREGFLSEERYPEATLMFGSFVESIKKISFHDHCYAVVASSSHASDEEILYHLMDKLLTYVGMLGSQKKVDSIKAHLRERGVSMADLSRLHAPIGIPLGGQMPEEVALSILAELVRHKYQGGSK